MTSEKSYNYITNVNILSLRQSNHEDYFISLSVRHYVGELLYILVAHWCLQKQTCVDRNQVLEAFRITARRASYVMTCLRGKMILMVCNTCQRMLENHVYRYEIFVTEVKSRGNSRKQQIKLASSRSGRKMGSSSRPDAIWNVLLASRKTETEA